MRKEYYSQISIAAETIPNIDNYAAPYNNKCGSVSGYIQQNLFSKTTDSTSCGLLTASSIVITKTADINNNNFFVASEFTLFIKNDDDTYSNLPFNLSYVNNLPEPKAITYTTNSNQGTGMFLNKNVNIQISYSNSRVPAESWSKIILTTDDALDIKNDIKNIILDLTKLIISNI